MMQEDMIKMMNKKIEEIGVDVKALLNKDSPSRRECEECRSNCPAQKNHPPWVSALIAVNAALLTLCGSLMFYVASGKGGISP